MPRIATIHQTTKALGPQGRATDLPVGTYPVAELDGVPRSVAYVADGDGNLLACVNASDPNITISEMCVRCEAAPSTGLCCSSHRKELCHRCYRRTHFVEVCVAGCSACAREGLSVKLEG
jgi:hypothetical protein